MALLFGGLEPATSGEVISSLEQSGTVFEVRGSAIYVEAHKRDELRMALAGQGLPASNTQGYELLDSLTGFGTTSQMFDAAYWRAKEGELARTILASPNIRAARVHISSPNQRAFQRSQSASAAVNITTSGSGLNSRQISALQYLVASAVQGLSPDSVAVIDGARGLVSNSSDQGSSGAGEELARELKARAERLLAARVGWGNAVVEVSVETVSETELITERTFDPSARVAISTDITENTAKSQDSGSGDVTVASNLPDGAASGEGGGSSNENSESRALTNYEVNETQRQLTKGPGDVRRLTVAVLVNDVITIDTEGTTTATPRSPEELDALRDLVASSVGFNETRGDQITLKSMPFEALSENGTDAIASTGTPLNMMRLIQIGVLAIVSLILGLFVVKPILMPNQRRAIAPPAQTPAIEQPKTNTPLSITSNPDGSEQNPPVAIANALSAPVDAASDPVTRLRKMISERETETIQILQDWMEYPDETEEA